MAPHNVFAGAYLDRRAEERELADWFDAALADPHTLYVVMHGTRVLVRTTVDAAPQAVNFVHGNDPRVTASTPEDRVLLGWFENRRCVLIEVKQDDLASTDETYAELRPLAARLPERDAGLVAYARALAIWRANHRFCSRCGGPMHATRAGHVLHC